MRRCLAVALLVVVSACGSDTTFGEEFRDVKVAERDDEPATIIEMPNGYSNVAVKCHGSVGVYVTRNTNGRAVAVVPNDSNCVAQ